MKNLKEKKRLVEVLDKLSEQKKMWLRIETMNKKEWKALETRLANWGIYWSGTKELKHRDYDKREQAYISSIPALHSGETKLSKTNDRQSKTISFKDFMEGRYVRFTKIYVVNKEGKQLLMEWGDTLDK